MLNFGNKEFRNLQEQVGKNQEDIQKIKEGLGTGLPDPIPGPQGPQGPQGEQGLQGRTPIISIGTGPLPQSGYQFRDIYIASQTGNGVVKGGVYQMNDIGRWVLQMNITGPQGLPGQDIDEVIANPDGEAIEDIEKISIDGIIYTIRAEDTYTKEEVDEIIEAIKKNKFIPVDTDDYPTLEDFLASTGEEGVIYLYPNNTADLTQGYKQYIWELNDWIYIGNTSLDLSGYARLSGNNTFTGNNTFNKVIFNDAGTKYIEDKGGSDLALYTSFLLFYGNAIRPETFGATLGLSNRVFGTTFTNNIKQLSGILTTGNHSFGVKLPSTTNFTDNKELATTEQITPQWYGTQAQYDALGTYDSNTIYNILES